MHTNCLVSSWIPWYSIQARLTPNACLEHTELLTVHDKSHVSSRIEDLFPSPESMNQQWRREPGQARQQVVSSKYIGWRGGASRQAFVLEFGSTTSVLTATTLKYTTGAGITAGAGTRLVLQLLLRQKFELPPSQTKLLVPFLLKVGNSRHYLTMSVMGNFRACCRP